MKNLIILITIGLFFSLNACKPVEPIENIIQYPINTELKSYFGNFKEGSWWVYKDTVSGYIDTFTLTKYSPEDKKFCYYQTDNKDVYTTSLYYKIEHNLTNTGYISFRVFSDCAFPKETLVNMHFGAGKGEMNLIFQEEGFLEKDTNSNNDTILTSFHSQFTLNNVNYNDVYYIENTGESSFYSEYSYIISKNIGIIGFNAKDHNDYLKAYWVLIDKNIVL